MNELRKRPIVKRGGLPDFHIIGAQKSGTSSLFRYIASHPRVYGPYKKKFNTIALIMKKELSGTSSTFRLIAQKKKD